MRKITGYYIIAVFLMRNTRISKYLSDRLYLQLVYKGYMNKVLNLENPVSFSEKLQWLKLNDRKDIYTSMVDKYEVKRYISEKIGEKYIIPTLGVWTKFSEIDFEVLPEQFVIKCTHDSGGLVICRNKDRLNKKHSKRVIEKSLKRNYFFKSREWPYKNVKPRIIVEKYMSEFDKEGLIDYKFYCFNGEPKFLYISKGLENHETASISFVTLNWEFANYKRTDYKPFVELPPKPKCFEEMLFIAKELASGIPFVRVDLYQINGNVYFSELTFSPCGGMMPFADEMHDVEIGGLLKLE